MRVGDPLRGNCASLSRAAKRSSIGKSLLFAISLSSERLAASRAESRLRLLFRSIMPVLAISLLRLALLPEGEVELFQKRTRLVVRLGGRAHDDVHPPDLLDLVVVDFGEDDVLLDAHRIIAAPIEALRVQAPEVLHPRKRDGDETVQELVHARPAERDLAADRHVIAQLEGRDRLAGLGDNRLLPGNER